MIEVYESILEQLGSQSMIEIKSMHVKNIYQSFPTDIKDQMPAPQTSTTNSSSCLHHHKATRYQHCQMPQIETLNLPWFVVRLPYHLARDVQRWHGYQSDVEFQCHREVLGYFPLEIVFVMSEATKILSIVPHCFAELLGMIDLLISKTTSIQTYFPRVMISL